MYHSHDLDTSSNIDVAWIGAAFCMAVVSWEYAMQIHMTFYRNTYQGYLTVELPAIGAALFCIWHGKQLIKYVQVCVDWILITAMFINNGQI